MAVVPPVAPRTSDFDRFMAWSGRHPGTALTLGGALTGLLAGLGRGTSDIMGRGYEFRLGWNQNVLGSARLPPYGEFGRSVIEGGIVGGAGALSIQGTIRTAPFFALGWNDFVSRGNGIGRLRGLIEMLPMSYCLGLTFGSLEKLTRYFGNYELPLGIERVIGRADNLQEVFVNRPFQAYVPIVAASLLTLGWNYRNEIRDSTGRGFNWVRDRYDDVNQRIYDFTYRNRYNRVYNRVYNLDTWGSDNEAHENSISQADRSARRWGRRAQVAANVPLVLGAGYLLGRVTGRC